MGGRRTSVGSLAQLSDDAGALSLKTPPKQHLWIVARASPAKQCDHCALPMSLFGRWPGPAHSAHKWERRLGARVAHLGPSRSQSLSPTSDSDSNSEFESARKRTDRPNGRKQTHRSLGAALHCVASVASRDLHINYLSATLDKLQLVPAAAKLSCCRRQSKHFDRTERRSP